MAAEREADEQNPGPESGSKQCDLDVGLGTAKHLSYIRKCLGEPHSFFIPQWPSIPHGLKERWVSLNTLSQL